jgi:hypothetical protein
VKRWTTAVAMLLVLFSARAGFAQSDIADGRRNDLAVFRRDFFARDSSYSSEHRRAAEARLTRLESQAASVTAAQFELELARIVALADNGHTSSPAALRSRRYGRVPIRFVPFGDQFYILRADPTNADLLGGRLLAIDGKSIRDVKAVAHTLWGGLPSWRDRFVPFFIESPDQMQALGVTGRAESASYRVELRNGRTVERRIVADPPNAGREFWNPSRWLTPDPLDAQDTWKSLGASERTPWAFQEPARLFRLRMATDLNALVVQLRANHAPGVLASFLDSAVAEIRRAQPRHIVLDLRTNGGGDLNNTREFVKLLPTLVTGRVFVLTSPWTFSAAISTTGYLKQAGGDRVTIVGEMVGDRLEFWAEGRLARLPFSGSAMSYSTQRHDYKTGCRPYPDCHGAVVRNPISVPSLAPEIEAPLTIEAFIAGRDPGMDAIARAIRGSAPNG